MFRPLAPLFPRPKEVQQHLPSVNAIARDLAARLEAAKYAVNDEVNDLRLEVGKWSLENAASLVFDRRLGCFDSEGEGKELGRIMVEANAKIFKVINRLVNLIDVVRNVRFFLPVWPFHTFQSVIHI